MKLLVFFVFLVSFLQAQMVVATHNDSEIQTLQKELVQYLYLGKIESIKGVRVRVLLSKQRELHAQFCKEILGKSESQYNSYWARLVFTGKKSMAKRLSAQEIKEQMEHKNSITYIKKEQLPKGWRIVYEK